MQLAEKVVESKLIKTIALPTKRVKGGEAAVISGWGTMRSPVTSASKALRKLDTKIISQFKCQLYFFGARDIVKSQVCAFKKRGTGVCSVR